MTFITFTSLFGSDGEKIAKEVAENLDITFFDDRKQQEQANALGIDNKDLDGLDIQSPGFFDRLFSNKPAIYLDVLASVVYDIASKGEGVILGHGAQLFLKDFNCALHIMLYEPAEKRIKHIMNKQQLSESVARKLVQNKDKNYNEFIRYAFNRDCCDTENYDLILNLDKISFKYAVKLIADLGTSEEIKMCSLKALEKMEALSLQRRIEAAIIKSGMLSTYNQIFVQVIGIREAHLTGIANSENVIRKVVEDVKRVPGVEKVTSDIMIAERSA